MKKLIYLAMAFGLVACQAEKVDVNGGLEGKVETNFLSINIMAANGGGTRANYDSDNSYEDGDYADESKVNEIFIYFFDDEGEGVPVKANGTTSVKRIEINGNSEANAGADAPNVEHKLKATVILQRAVDKNTGKIVDLPKEAIVVVNPNGKVKALGTESLVSKNALLDCIDDLGDAEAGKFIMSSTVYADNGEKQIAVSLEGHLAPTKDAAIKNPVKVYVERVVAKVTRDLKEGLVNEDNLIDTKVEYGNGKKIYVRFEGWNVTATADKSRLIKEIDPAWPNSFTEADGNLFQTANEPWNYANFYRSFWAVNPADVQLQYGPYADSENGVHNPGEIDNDKGNPANANKFSGGSEKLFAYLQENAGKELGTLSNNYAEAANAAPSQVIIAGTLVDENGDPIELVEYADKKFDYDDLDDLFLSYLQPRYWYSKTETPSVFKQIGKEEIEFETAWSNGKADATPDSPRYHVYAKLTTAAASDEYTWYKEKPTGNTLEDASKIVDDVTEIDAALKALGHAKVWKSGMTYYFLNIRHLASPRIDNKYPAEEGYNVTKAAEVPGFYGVVRNHVYKTTINSVFGLGTPVYDPDEVIIPQIPKDEDVFLAAEINILSWRIVDHGYDLNW